MARNDLFGLMGFFLLPNLMMTACTLIFFGYIYIYNIMLDPQYNR